MNPLLRLNKLLSPLFHFPPSIRGGEVTLSIRPESLLFLVKTLRNHTPFQFVALQDLTCIDFPEHPFRFQLVYQFLSYRFNSRLSVRVSVAQGESVPSLSTEFPSAGWAEREVWDLFGVPFSGNPDLRRILTDYGFDGHPLRKEFPLSGFAEVRYDEQKHRVISEPIQFLQRPRRFQFGSAPWSVDPDSTYWVENPPPPPTPENEEIEERNED